jgi:YVTN family beta-propeller protein
MDDNNGDWTSLVSGPNASHSGRPVGWDLSDNDLAIIDTVTSTVSYARHLMTICMAIGVNPASGDVSIVGTEATNEIRFEPVVQGRFTRVEIARVAPAGPATLGISDLNSHLTYAAPRVPQSERNKSLGDPRGIAWDSSGTKGYVTGMGSNNLVVIDSSGQRAGIAPTIAVGEGPTGIVIDTAHGRLLVMDKFEGAISVVDIATELETTRVSFHDPSPAAIKAGRKHLYDTHKTSGLGQIACASCHVDSRFDRLAWDLGNPAGTMKPTTGQNLGGGLPGLTARFKAWHRLAPLAGLDLGLAEPANAHAAEPRVLGVGRRHEQQERLLGAEAGRRVLEGAGERVLLVAAGAQHAEHLVHRGEQARVSANGLGSAHRGWTRSLAQVEGRVAGSVLDLGCPTVAPVSMLGCACLGGRAAEKDRLVVSPSTQRLAWRIAPAPKVGCVLASCRAVSPPERTVS